MAAKWIETLTGSLEQKKQYKQDKARIEALPEPYGTAAQAFHRYFMYYGGITDGDTLLTMFGDFADLWERAAADGMPLREIVEARLLQSAFAEVPARDRLPDQPVLLGRGAHDAVHRLVPFEIKALRERALQRDGQQREGISVQEA